MENNLKNQSYFFIKQITEIGITTLISAYFFTTGYINSFSLPIRVDFSQAGYFFISLFTDSIPIFLFSLFKCIMELPLYIFSLFNNFPPDLLILYKIIMHPFITNLTFLLLTLTILIVFFIRLRFSFVFKKILFPVVLLWQKIKIMPSSLKFLFIYVLWIMFVNILFDRKDYKLFTSVFGNIQEELGVCINFSFWWKSELSCSMASVFLYNLEMYANDLIKFFFILNLLVITFAIPVSIKLFLNKNNRIQFKSLNFISFISTILLSISFSYYSGSVYSGRFIDHPVYRSNIKTAEKRVQIWRDSDSYFYVKCSENNSSLIEGVNSKTNKIFYIGYLDESTHPNLCTKSKNNKTINLKNKKVYSQCYYKSNNNEIFLANSCLIASSYILVTPKGKESQCYIQTSQIVALFEHSKFEPIPPPPKDAIRYQVNEEHLKHYEDNYKHYPKVKKMNYLSSSGFSVKQYVRTGSKEQASKIIFENLSEEKSARKIEQIDLISKALYGYKAETVRFAFQGIKKYFPKCD